MRTIKLFIVLIVLCSAYSFADEPEPKEVLEIRKQYQEAKQLEKNTKNKKFTTSYKNTVKEGVARFNINSYAQYFYSADVLVLITKTIRGWSGGTIYSEELFDNETGELIFIFYAAQGAEDRCYFRNGNLIHVKSTDNLVRTSVHCYTLQQEANAKKEALQYFY